MLDFEIDIDVLGGVVVHGCLIDEDEHKTKQINTRNSTVSASSIYEVDDPSFFISKLEGLSWIGRLQVSTYLGYEFDDSQLQ